MKRFLLKLTGILPFFLLVGAVNYTIDAEHHLTDDKALQNAADRILGGHSVATRERILQHDFVKYYIGKQREKDDVNVMGSSKCMVIDSGFFPKSSFFNYYVSNSSFVEFLAITHWLNQKELLPDTLIMELSFSQFHNMYTGQPRYYFKACETFCRQLDISPPEMEGPRHKSPAYQLFSLSYFWQNITHKPKERYFVSEDPQLKNHFVLHPDGSLWVGQYLEFDTEEKERRVQDPGSDKLNWVKQLDDKVKNGFRTLIQFLKEKNTTVILYLPPYHPETYRLYVNDNPLFEELEDFADELQTDFQIERIGAYNPHIFQLSDEDFYDALHNSRAGFTKIWESRTGNLTQAQANL